MYRHSLRLTVGHDWLRSSVAVLLHRLPRGVVNEISKGILEVLVELAILVEIMGVSVELPSMHEGISRLPFSVGELDGCLSVNTEMLIVRSHH
jgi:hypothetical protein